MELWKYVFNSLLTNVGKKYPTISYTTLHEVEIKQFVVFSMIAPGGKTYG